MVKRLFSLVIALVIGSAPVLLDVCQITCGSTAAHSARAHDAHGDARHHHDPATHGSCHEPLLRRACQTHIPAITIVRSPNQASRQAAIPTVCRCRWR